MLSGLFQVAVFKSTTSEQHSVSSQTFEAQMAVGSWYNIPLMNDLSAITLIMQMKGRCKASGKGKFKEY
ncbi:hypothetical protein BDR07DRAFT_1411808 [Suillus spraguei]|nr:hypothetical protein BDR07DRAFT_1442329 [Suillus spraguei]KAG2360681.1 hypothetical protein BDR07DRAFT_1411808 [Suillus spraguei]